MTDTVHDVLVGIRLITSLLMADWLGVDDVLRDTTEPVGQLDETERRVLAALVALGVAEGNERPAFASSWAALGRERSSWDDLISLVRHQLGYANLADDLRVGRKISGPAEQGTAPRDQYRAFLEGVDRTHRGHARWFSALPVLERATTLADLGGGLGTFSCAWVESRPSRHALLADLPDTVEIIDEIGTIGRVDRIDVVEVDLRLPTACHVGADLTLLANVLHLLSDWRGCLAAIADRMRVGSMLAVLEADPEVDGGPLFDLQVHLRSGLMGGLLPPEAIGETLRSFGTVETIDVPDANDPLRRHYRLWLMEGR